jgi:hypothetical protein
MDKFESMTKPRFLALSEKEMSLEPILMVAGGGGFAAKDPENKSASVFSSFSFSMFDDIHDLISEEQFSRVCTNVWISVGLHACWSCVSSAKSW